MADRSAVDTIRGYFYQFDLSILTLLNLPKETDSIEVECIEDIDIQTASHMTALQCKYYAKTEYNHAVIKDAVKHMLSHYKDVRDGAKEKICYHIRGFFSSGQEKLDINMDVDFLKKNFLTYTVKKITHHYHVELGLNDIALAEFIKLLKIDVRALEFDAQLNAIINSFKINFSCNDFSAEYFYYNNALRVIKELSIQAKPKDRRITKKEFMKRINTSAILFNEWFIQKKGRARHLSSLRKEYFTQLNISPFERFFLIEVEPSSYVRSELKELIFVISKKWSKISSWEPKPFCPYIFLQGLPDDEMLFLKRELINENLKFIDGFDYQGAEFNPESIAQKATNSNGIKVKILNSLNNLNVTLDCIKATRNVYQFYITKEFYTLDNAAVHQVKIQISSLGDIKEII